MQLGSKFHGSSQLETSIASKELVPSKQFYYKFSFMNDQDCTVSINESDPIFIRAGLGFTTNQIDVPIRSFKILEDGITYNWIGGSR